MNLSEDQHSIELAIWLDRRKILYTHVPNGGKRDPVEAAKFKAMGVKRGVPDYLIFTQPQVMLWDDKLGAGRPLGTAIELKKIGGRTRPDQTRWVKRLQALGWAAMICEGHQNAIERLTALGYDQIFDLT